MKNRSIIKNEDDDKCAYKIFNESVNKMKLGRGWALFYKIKERFNVENVENKNNILHFFIDGEKYLFGLKSSKIKLKGDNTWTGKVLTTLKKYHEK